MLPSYAFRLCAVALLATALFTPRAYAQVGDDLSIYGFFQGQGRYNTQSTTTAGVTTHDESTSFSVQQLNLFLAHQFTPSFSAFVNTEIRNTLSTADGFGELLLEEAWVRYNHNSAFNIKAGRLIPTFNNLNEVKNRMPLLPYIFRPAVYESSYARVLGNDQFVPDQAYLQVYGAVPMNEVRFDYAAYVGNSDATNLAQISEGATLAGSDTTVSKLVGGRVGIRWRSLKAGVSSTFDKHQHSQFAVAETVLPMPGVGTINRTRVGADVSFSRGPIFGEAEVIQVLYHPDGAQQTALDQVELVSGGVFDNSLDASFYYALLGANITEKWFAYGRYDYYGSASVALDFITAGGGFRPIDPIALKLQYVYAVSRENIAFEMDTHSLMAAVSVQF